MPQPSVNSEDPIFPRYDHNYSTGDGDIEYFKNLSTESTLGLEGEEIPRQSLEHLGLHTKFPLELHDRAWGRLLKEYEKAVSIQAIFFDDAELFLQALANTIHPHSQAMRLRTRVDMPVEEYFHSLSEKVAMARDLEDEWARMTSLEEIELRLSNLERLNTLAEGFLSLRSPTKIARKAFTATLAAQEDYLKYYEGRYRDELEGRKSAL